MGDLLVSDPDEVALLGPQRASEQWSFYEKAAPRLQAGDQALIARMETTLAAVMAQIDCTACGRCCAHMGPAVSTDEAGLLAAALAVSAEDLRRRYLRPMWPGAAADDQVWLLPDPCPLHDGRLCTVYAARPQVCRDFPQAVGANAAERLAIWVDMARICPITYHTVERLLIAENDPTAANGA